MNALACRLNNTSTLNSACTRLSPKRNAEARSPSRLDGPGARSVSWACRSEAPPNDYSVPGTLTSDLEHAMKYLCLAYEEEKKLNALSQSEWDALRSETLAYVEALRKSGHLIVTHALQSVRTATTVRVRSGKQSVTDGPFAETKEQLGGFFLIDARDLNEAIQVASRWPSVRFGTMEVRPVKDFPGNSPATAL